MAVAIPTGETAALVMRGPIFIKGDSGFTEQNGVTGGNGTRDSPFLIEGWEINASITTGIRIEETAAHFVIRNVTVHSGEWRNPGISFYRVSNARIENDTVTNNRVGISVESARNLTIERSRIYANWHGGFFIDVSDTVLLAQNNITETSGAKISVTSNVSITRNTFEDFYWPLDLVGLRNVAIADNEFGNVVLTGSENVSIERNTIPVDPFSANSITVYTSANVTIANNALLGGTLAAFWSEKVTVAGNDLNSGMRLYASTRFVIQSNTLIGGGVLIDGYDLLHFNSHNITRDNLINGLPVVYYRNCNDLVVDGIALGQLLVANCVRVRASNLTISGASAAMEIAFVDQVIIDGNDVHNSTYGIFALSSSEFVVEKNEFSGNKYGVYCETCAGITIVRNNVSSNGEPISEGGGIFVGDSSSALIADNNVSFNLGLGLTLAHVNDALITGNFVWGNHNGIILWEGSTGIRVHRNIVAHNGEQARDHGAGNWWDNGYPSGGNYWSDYPGVDDCSGPDQGVCTGPDGFGDSSYVLPLNSRDRYPLFALPGTEDDTEAPQVAIASPVNGEAFGDRVVQVRGTANDTEGSGVARVLVRANNGSWTAARGTANWSASVVIGLGTNLIEAHAWDHAGNPSTIASVLVVGKERRLRLTVLADRQNYTPGEEVNLVVQLTNLGNESVTVAFPSGCQASFLVDDLSGNRWYTLSQACAAVLTSLRLGPGESRDYPFVWDQTSDSGIQVPPNACYFLEGLLLSREPVTSYRTMIRIGTPSYNTVPHASFMVDPTAGDTLSSFFVDASGSLDCEDSLSDLDVRWDWEADGTWDTNWSREKVAWHQYRNAGNYTIRVEVRDSGGLSDTAERRVAVIPAPDRAGPLIIHTPPSTAVIGASVTIAADVQDPSGVGEVALFYRSIQASEYARVTMAAHGNGVYQAQIPPQQSRGTLGYFIVAEDGAGNLARMPEMGEFRVFVVSPPPSPGDASPPIIAFTVAVLAGIAVLVVWRFRRRRSRG